jgi:hypothetical protein
MDFVDGFGVLQRLWPTAAAIVFVIAVLGFPEQTAQIVSGWIEQKAHHLTVTMQEAMAPATERLTP